MRVITGKARGIQHEPIAEFPKLGMAGGMPPPVGLPCKAAHRQVQPRQKGV